MAGLSTVPGWVITLISNYVLPTDVVFSTTSSFATLDEAADPVSTSEATYTFDYPGLIPNATLDVSTTPTTGGLNFTLIAKKAIGFYGVLSTILSFDAKRLNSWTFPLVRKNFGYLALSREGKVSAHSSVAYERQYHLDPGVIALASNYDIEAKSNDIFNNIDQFALNKVSGFQYPGVTTRISFLPIVEEWAVKFFQKNS